MVETQHQAAGAIDKQRSKDGSGPGLGKGGVPVPSGRPKGTPNKVTRTIREAVEMAAKDCHPKGLAGWLVERAQGSLGDRQIFAAMVNKAMPLQVNTNVDGGIRLDLGWLAGRQIGTTQAQIPAQQPQALDLKQDSDGLYRIVDPVPVAEPVQGGANSDPPPPLSAGGGGGG